ncbi:type III pantothenate kinase [Thermaurantimonas aggregans]|uniref:Type III pantothenate kinase n=1 Tax=Thermaurantimonas aggregans TaxID=2173829 RepID=A0A401XLL9_9FLAO|nr:type III pantothenate kinase [Thermaurantimonas aggregans]MCX8147835.1 type III pantothenate kinase [Thermaurantimonas aggregans]GCD77916.1 type III pantothenate kinase [Thermaurantimonas aggregans]
MTKKNFLLADVGNTYTKVEVHYGVEIQQIAFNSFTDDRNFPRDQWQHIIKEYDVQDVFYSSVIPAFHSEIEQLNVSGRIMRVHSELRLPFTIAYCTPFTLGSDRICVVSAAAQRKSSASLIISAGTCITFDVLVGTTYIGGSISPGVKMRAKAMHHFTQALPEVDVFKFNALWKEENPLFVGKTTEECLLAGSVQGAAFEINEYINRLSQMHENLNIYLTGGDAITLEKLIKSDIFARPNMCLEGLNILYKLNA